MNQFDQYCTTPNLQINKICRACMSDKIDSMQSLFKQQMADMFTSITSIKVSEDDGLPDLLCFNCSQNITTMFSFKKQCQRSDATLRQYIPGNFKYIRQESHQSLCESLIKTDQHVYRLPSENSICQNVNNSLYGEFDFMRGIAQDPLHNDSQNGHDSNIQEGANISSNIKFQLDKTSNENKYAAEQPQSLELLKIHSVLNTDSEIDLSEKDSKVENICNLNTVTDFNKSTDNKLVEHEQDFKSCVTQNESTITLADCTICNRKFKSTEGLKKHMRKHKGVLRLPCGICKEILAEETSLKAHLKTHKDSGLLACQICTDKFSDWGKLFAHRFSHLRQQLEGDRNILYCQTCSKSFRSLERLEAHLRIHMGKKPEVCTVCGMDFNDLRCLKRHMLKHETIKKYSCTDCGKRFTYCNSLNQHLKIHKNIRKFVCDLCGKAFVQSNGLTAHMKTHSTGTPYACELCGRKLKSPESLKSHLLRHSGVKKFICSICGKAFSTSSERITHIRTHTGEKPYPCRSCPKSFLTQSHLTVHMRSHTGARPFECDLCPLKFATSQVLKKHRMTHTGEKPHVCVVCQRAFTQKNVLKTHMKTHQQLLQRVY